MAGAIDRDLESVMPKPSENAHSNLKPRERGLALERFFTRPGVDPMSEIEWDFRTAVIAGEDGRVVFVQK
ncbi:MAG TPA: hypothetical protein VLL57_08645, partial [Candidatus Binataceae bacterium]|nr:hypothetical protein [Candidatus Binataceae bacterium]